MELIYGLLAGGVAGFIGGCVLTAHIHSISNAAAARISTIGMVSGTTLSAPVEPAKVSS